MCRRRVHPLLETVRSSQFSDELVYGLAFPPLGALRGGFQFLVGLEARMRFMA